MVSRSAKGQVLTPISNEKDTIYHDAQKLVAELATSLASSAAVQSKESERYWRRNMNKNADCQIFVSKGLVCLTCGS